MFNTLVVNEIYNDTLLATSNINLIAFILFFNDLVG